MNHPIPIGCSTDQPPFWVVDDEVSVSPVPIAAVSQFSLDLNQILFQVQVEHGRSRLETLGLLGFACRHQQVFKAGYFIKQTVVAFHGKCI